MLGRVCSINLVFGVHSVIISAKRKKIKEGFPKEVTFDIVFFLQVEGSKVCPRILPIY